jgi:small-conductance mechanosensitive channel
LQKLIVWLESIGINQTVLHRIGLTILVFGLLVGLRRLLLSVGEKWVKRRRHLPEHLGIKRYFSTSLTLVLLTSLSHLALPLFSLPVRTEAVVTHVVQIVLIASMTWLLIRVTSFIEQVLYIRYDYSVPDNLLARRMRTQVQFVVRLIYILICLIGFSVILLSFDGARKIGASLIASAGVASVVVGFAAQKSLANLIAGFQIAFTQPIRIDDVVIVETEWGRIEEITLTYVVVKLWDLRRMVLPITYFVEKPFQNWTRHSADLLCYSFLYMDYRVPVDEVRKAFREILEHSPLWDKRVCILQVTDLKEHTIELRALMSARNASDSFDLRCEVREKLVDYIRKSYPDSLPRTRAELVETEASVSARKQPPENNERLV